MRRTLEELCEGYRFVFAMPLEIVYTGPVSALQRPLHFLGVQRVSTSLNAVQRLSTPEILAVLKSVEYLSPVTSEPPLKGRAASGGSC
jgi:hypothetical protein